MTQAAHSIVPEPSIPDARELIAVCQAISAETSEAGIGDRGVTLGRSLVGASDARLYLGESPSTLKLRASSPKRSSPLRLLAAGDAPVPERVLAVATSLRITHFDDACLVPVVHGGLLRGVLAFEGGAAPRADHTVVGLIADQIGIAISNADQYTTLEQLVDQEMRAAVEREQAMQLVLDSMGDGLLVCELDGTITPTRSKSACEWFGNPAAGDRIWTYLAGDDAAIALELELAFQAMAEDVLPFEVNSTLGPRRITRGERTYALAYKQVFVNGAFAQLVVSIVDATEAIACERAERAARELAAVVGNLIRDRACVVATVAEVERLLGELGTTTDDVVRSRVIHTLKGTSAGVGFQWFSATCHELETELEGDASAFAPRHLDALRTAWRESLAPLAAILGASDLDRSLRVLREEHDDLLFQLASRVPYEELATTVRAWLREPIAPTLEGLGNQAARLATQLGKSLAIDVDAPGRMPDLPLAPVFAQLVHATRNAVDHGIEPPEERVAKGKPEIARLSLTASVRSNAFEIVVADDGRGVDWDRIRAKATALGLAADTDEALAELLFHDGLSTRETVTTVSGRGIGLGSLREAARVLRGDVHVASEPGRGTRVTVRVPLAEREGRPTLSP